jgi:hypothetical protein
VKIKLQVSTRETPVMPVVPVAQIEQDYFKLLGFPSAQPFDLDGDEDRGEQIIECMQHDR